MHDPTEHVQEHLTHEAAHGGHGEGPSWISSAALTAAILAALAAVSGNLATTHLTQSTHKRIDANDKWSYYQSKSIKNYLMQAQNSIVQAAVPAASMSEASKKDIAGNIRKMADNEKDKVTTSEEAHELETLSDEHLEAHEAYELSATMFHISIAIVAIAVVAKRKEFWYMSMVSGVIGLYFFGNAVVHAPAREKPVVHATAGTAPAEHGKAPAGETAGAAAAAANHGEAAESSAHSAAKPSAPPAGEH